jgi:hypothetical protein
MKRVLVLLAVLFLTHSLAWAEGGPHATPPDPAGGRCVLPDLAQLSPDQVAIAALQAGLEITPKTAAPIPACPVLSQCSDVPGCGLSGGPCTSAILGKCCTTGAAVLCCPNEIVVTRCPCHCVFEDCPTLRCNANSQVTRSCT